MYQLFQQRRHRHPPVRITRDMKEKRGGSCPLSPVRAVFRIVCRDSTFTFLMLLFLPHCTDFLFQELKPGAGKEQSPDPPKQRSVLQGVDTQLTCHRSRRKRTDPPFPGARRLGRPRLHGQQHLLGRLPHKTSHSYLLGTLSPSRVSQASKGQLRCSTCQDQNPRTIADLLASVQSTQKPSHILLTAGGGISRIHPLLFTPAMTLSYPRSDGLLQETALLLTSLLQSILLLKQKPSWAMLLLTTPHPKALTSH